MSVATAGVMRRLPALNLPPPVAVGLAAPLRSPAITFGVIRGLKAIGSLKLASGICALVATTLAILTYQEENHNFKFAPVAGETIMLRQEQESYTQTEQTVPFEDQEGTDEAVPSNYPRPVRTLSFVNLAAAVATGTRSSRVAKGGLNARTQVATDNFQYRGEGLASWYGPDFHGKRTANGERYDMNGISAAHRTMPLPSYARVTNLDNGRSIIVRVNNRGPYVHRRIVDLSVGTAKALDFYKKGTTHVRVEYVGRAPVQGSDDQMLLATLRTGTPAPAPSNVMVASAKPFLPKSSDGRGFAASATH